MTAMRVLVTGAAGQVGMALRATLPKGIDARFVTRADLDIGNVDQVRSYVGTMQPDLIINAAAYTAVDKAESDKSSAIRVNTHAPAYLAQTLASTSAARLIQVSTDFVFDGNANTPYLPTQAVAPVNAYGETKADGEAAVVHALRDRSTIVRTAWVYSSTGHNFLRTMLRLLNERGEVSVVDDQIGSPTSARSLAEVLWGFAVRRDLAGVFHWTDGGVASWYDFAVAIAEEGRAAGVLNRECTVRPIPTVSYPTPARRPAYSVLNKQSTVAALGQAPDHWRVQLRTVMQELAGA